MKRSVLTWRNILTALGRPLPRSHRRLHRRPKWEWLESRQMLAAMSTAAEGEGAIEHIWLKADQNTLDSYFNINGIAYGGIGYGSGVDNQAFKLDGLDDEIRVTRKASKDAEGTSYSFWFQKSTEGPNGDQNLLVFRVLNGTGWSLVSKANGALEFRSASSSRTYQTLYTSGVLDAGWHCVTLSLNDARQQIALQIDNKSEVLQNYKGQIPGVASGYVSIGASAFKASWFNGFVDEFHIVGLHSWSSRVGIHTEWYNAPIPLIGDIQLADGSLTSNVHLAENASPGTRLGQVQWSRFSGSFNLSDDSAGAFQIATNGELVVNQGADLDFEKRSFRSITVEARGPNGRVRTRNFSVQLDDVNEPITDIALSVLNVNAYAPVGSRIANARAVDPDVDDTFVYALVSTQNGSVGTTADALTIDATNGLITKATAQVLVSTDASFIVQATDRAGHFFRKGGVLAIYDSLPSMWPAGDEKQLWISSPIVEEGGSAHVKIRRATSQQNSTLTVQYRTEDRTASGVNQTRSGGDYLAKQGTLVFAPGELEKEIEVVTLYDYLNEDLESLLIRATATNFGTVTSAISITNKQLPTLRINDQDAMTDPVLKVVEGSKVRIDVSEFVDPIHGPVAYSAARTFEYSTRDWSATSSDYQPVQGIIDASQTESTRFTIVIPAFSDLNKEDQESFILRIKTPWNTNAEVPISILDNSKQIPKARFTRVQEFVQPFPTQSESDTAPIFL